MAELTYEKACRCAQCFIADDQRMILVFTHYISNAYNIAHEWVFRDLEKQKELYKKHRDARGTIKSFEDGKVKLCNCGREPGFHIPHGNCKELNK